MTPFDTECPFLATQQSGLRSILVSMLAPLARSNVLSIREWHVGGPYRRHGIRNNKRGTDAEAPGTANPEVDGNDTLGRQAEHI